MVEHKYIQVIVQQMIKQNLNDHRRKFLISCLRNLLFDVETYEEQFLDLGVPKDICKVLIDEQGLKSELPEGWPEEFSAKADKDASAIDFANTSQLIECLFLLHKSPVLLQKLRDLKAHEILLKVNMPKTKEYVDVTHRIDELVIQLAMPGATEADSSGLQQMAAAAPDAPEGAAQE